ncbi:tautomerase family protein [Pseudochelatococcus sp. B33]
MPLLRFNMLEGRTDAETSGLLEAAHTAVVAAFNVSKGNWYQIVSEYKPGRIHALDIGLGISRTEKLIIVEVTSRARPEGQKKAFSDLLCAQLKKTCDLDSSDIIVTFVENGDANWSFGHGRAQFLTGELS